MKSITRLTKLLQVRKGLFIILFILNHVVFAQDNGYWDDRFGPPTPFYDVVSAIAVDDSNIYVPYFGEKIIAKWSGNGWSRLGGEANGEIIAFAVTDDYLYVGGKFTTVGGITANNIAQWHFVTQSWSALESDGNNGINGPVWALAVSGNDLYVGGEFTTAGGIPANNIAKWNIATNSWKPLEKGVNGTVYTIATSGNKVYVGGSFTSAGGKQGNNIAKWDGKEWLVLGNGVNHQVNAIAILNRDVYVGGYFTKAGDVDANAIAKWNIIDKSWSALSSGAKNGVYYYSGIGNVIAMAANDRAVYVGGTFNQAGDQSANNIAKWDPSNNSWSPLGSGVSSQVFAIAARYKDVYVGGGFRYAGDKRSDRFAIWHEPNEPPVLAALPSLRFEEDKSLLHPIRDWYPFVADKDHADSTLTFAIQSGKNVKAARQAGNFRFSAPVNWFGKDTLQLIIKDPGQLADTTALMLTVNPVNDAPKISGLPDSLTFKKGGSAQLKLWDYVEDIETPDRQLTYTFSTSNPSLQRSFDHTTGVLVLAAPQFHGRAQLFINASDSKAGAHDSVAVQVELPTGVAGREEQIPADFVLSQNYPNPFNPTTLIRFGLPHDTEAKIEVLDLSGRHIATLLNERKPAGFHQVQFDARNLSTGLYFYRLTAGQFTAMKKLMLVQ